MLAGNYALFPFRKYCPKCIAGENDTATCEFSYTSPPLTKRYEKCEKKK
jgi:hypothetical protein